MFELNLPFEVGRHELKTLSAAEKYTMFGPGYSCWGNYNFDLLSWYKCKSLSEMS